MITPVGKLLRKPWYGLWRFVERHCFEGREYTIHVPSGNLVFTPWFADSAGEFSRFLDVVRNAGAAYYGPDRYYTLYQLAKVATRRDGQVAECGVFTGSTAHLISLIMAAAPSQRPVHLFDTFAGLPETAVPSRDYNAPGDYSGTSLARVQARLAAFPFVRFHPGFIPDTFGEIADDATFAFVHLDVNLYPSALECCRWFWPRMQSGGVMVVNDYGFRAYRYATRRAVDEFFAAQSDASLLVVPTGQAVVLKLAEHREATR